MSVLIHRLDPFKAAESFMHRIRLKTKTPAHIKSLTTVSRDDLDLYMRTIKKALGNSQYKHNVLAQKIFAARLTQLRLAAASQGR